MNDTLNVTKSLFFLIGKYNQAISHLEHVAALPEDLTPQVEGRNMSLTEREAFILGVNYCLEFLGGSLDSTYEEAQALQEQQANAKQQDQEEKTD